MTKKLAQELAKLTEELTAPAVVELTEAEIEAVAGGGGFQTIEANV
jgi:hypothetical protein